MSRRVCRSRKGLARTLSWGYRKVPPKQARSEETLRRILEAAESLIEEKGLADASIPEIVRRAGSSVGGFYGRLKDKNALLRALEERFFADLSERLERLTDAQRWEASSLAEIVAACAQELVSTARQRRNLIQAFLFRASQDPELHRATLRFRDRVSNRMRRLLLQRREPLRHPDPLVAIDLGVQLAFGLIFQLVLAGKLRAGGRVLRDGEIKNELEINFLLCGNLQVADEARHVEVYHRYLTEKLGLSCEVHPSLGQLLGDILRDARWDVTYLGMQIMVESLALAAFGMMKLMMADEPLIQDITTRIMSDESRHVAFGVISLADLYTQEMTGTELKEREDFVIEATHLLRDRLLMHQVFERLGWDVKQWVAWASETPFMQGFRQMTFSKIVPNLKRLGLLTPRVRAEYAKLGLLRFETLKDSVEEPQVRPPSELVQLLLQFLQESAHAGQGASR